MILLFLLILIYEVIENMQIRVVTITFGPQVNGHSHLHIHSPSASASLDPPEIPGYVVGKKTHEKIKGNYVNFFTWKKSLSFKYVNINLAEVVVVTKRGYLHENNKQCSQLGATHIQAPSTPLASEFGQLFSFDSCPVQTSISNETGSGSFNLKLYKYYVIKLYKHRLVINWVKLPDLNPNIYVSNYKQYVV